MKKWDWLQKFLYGLMGILGIYIIYKGGSILLQQDSVQKMLDTGKLQVALEDAAMRTHFPGYTAVVENRRSRPWMAVWMEPLVPVYSYMAEMGQKERRQDAGGFDTEQYDTEHDEKLSYTGQTDTGQADTGTEKSDAEREWKEQEMNQSGIEILMRETTEELMTDMPCTGAEISDRQDTAAKELITERINDQQTEVYTDVMRGNLNENSENTPNETMPLQNDTSSETVPVFSDNISPTLLQQLQNFDYLLNHYYTVDGGTSADAELLDAEILLSEDLSIEMNPDVPQILIYHTHSQEAFADSEEGNPEHTIVGMGEVLAEELRDCGYQVIHDTGVYDLVNGVLDRSAAYDYARASVQQILEENPTIEVVIDLHRDGVDGKKFVTEIEGKPTSMIMFFNGISRNSEREPLYWLENPYIQENLAFSLQLQLKAEEQYPGLTRNIYLKAERFNLHLRPRSLLIEAGTQLNTMEEERNAMAPLARLIYQVLNG